METPNRPHFYIPGFFFFFFLLALSFDSQKMI